MDDETAAFLAFETIEEEENFIAEQDILDEDGYRMAKDGEIANENGHRYGCECSECMQFYWSLKH